MTETWLGVYSTAPSTKSILKEVVSFHKSGHKYVTNELIIATIAFNMKLLLHLLIEYETCMYHGIPNQDITQTNLQGHVLIT